MKKSLILGLLILASCKPEVYLGNLDSPIGNWKGMDSKYYFAGENVWEDDECFYSAISFYKDSLCCIEGIKGAFNWTYEDDILVADSTVWKVIELSGRMMALDYEGRIEKEVTEETAEDGETPDGDVPSVSYEYKGMSIESDGSDHWYMNSLGEKILCFPKEKTEEDGSISIVCWWDTRSDFYKQF